MSLEDYRRKRDFRKSPEPAGKKRSSTNESFAFVVHRHEATRLHYDLRLEAEGVLKSWAVPRGFSYVRADKRLAVRTEDHPLEYLEFEGVIPKGEYGAGTMTIWDRGSYTLLKPDSLSEQIERGKIELIVSGQRLRGEWHLVRTKQDEKSWLLLKGLDCYARTDDDLPYPFDVDLSNADLAAPPRNPRPMNARDSSEPFSDPDWIFELKFRGLRVFVSKAGDAVRIVDAENGEDVPGLPNSVLEKAKKLRAERALVDAVLVVFDEQKRPSVDALKEALDGESPDRLTLCAFDLLYYDEWSVRRLPLFERKRVLESILPSRGLTYVDHVRGEGATFCSAVSRAGLTGVIAKRATSSYRGGENTTWREIPIEASAAKQKKNSLDLLKTGKKASTGFGRVRFTNRRKVYWPESGYTKGDLIAYYEAVAEHLLPYLHNRPIHMRRFPDGIDGKSFYHHNAPAHTPDWVKTEAIDHGDGKSVRYIICNDRETLLYLANLGSIDLHPWLSGLDDLDSPDWLIIDLDPSGAPFHRVVQVAKACSKLLSGAGLRTFLKTSGGSGLHITLPLKRGYTYDQARMFGELVARQIVRENPKICTVERSLEKRANRVYIDVLQNRRGQTVVPPYVLRPVVAASASTPLDWDELSTELDPTEFHLHSLPARLQRVGDLYQGTLSDRQDLLPAIEALADRMKK
ncbi:MAG: non-homologous end-joining DNA ligase [Planctomycetota bacterium]